MWYSTNKDNELVLSHKFTTIILTLRVFNCFIFFTHNYPDFSLFSASSTFTTTPSSLKDSTAAIGLPERRWTELTFRDESNVSRFFFCQICNLLLNLIKLVELSLLQWIETWKKNTNLFNIRLFWTSILKNDVGKFRRRSIGFNTFPEHLQIS